MPFPVHRMRRLRRTEPLRALVRETRLTADDLVYPLFVVPGQGVREEIVSMPGQYRLSVDRLIEEVASAHELGIRAVILFGIPPTKDAHGSGAWVEDGIVQRALSELRRQVPDVVRIVDVCLCEYTDHGHCGQLRGEEVDNDATLELLARTAVSQAEAGADVIAPSDMMDGRIGRIRAALDDRGHGSIPILSYAAKFASAYYGPFRDAADSAPSFGDRRGYQMDPANGNEAMREVELDLAEGADMVMVKPALAYLDLVRRVRERFDVPVAAYNVSGEYAMLEAAAQAGWIDRDRVVLETLTSMKRAGADLILTYHAPLAARLLAAGT